MIHHTKAFTLAEVLITLVIIGVVAALTLPSVLNKIEDRANIARWKKAYSVIANAFSSVKADGVQVCANHNRFDSTYCQNGGENIPISVRYGYITREFLVSFLSKLKVVSSCPGSDAGYDDEYVLDNYTCNRKLFNLTYYQLGTKDVLYYRTFRVQNVLLEDGTNLYFGQGQGVAYILADVNGSKKGPNTVGRDLFGAALKEDKIIPIGAEGSQGVNQPKDYYKDVTCSPKSIPDGNDGLLEFPNAIGAVCSYEYILK